MPPTTGESGVIWTPQAVEHLIYIIAIVLFPAVTALILTLRNGSRITSVESNVKNIQDQTFQTALATQVPPVKVVEVQVAAPVKEDQKGI